MTRPASPFVRVISCTTADTLAGPLADAITDIVGRPVDPAARSAMICALLGEIYESVAWVHGSDASPEELASLSQVTDAAHRHHLRMTSSNPDQDPGS